MALTQVTTGMIADAAVTMAKLSATGTPDATTFLRGDNTWGTAGAIGKQVVRLYTSGATWTKPAGLVQVKIEMWGAAGSGGAAVNSGFAGASGGGGCAYGVKTVLAALLGATETITVGAGGAGVSRSTAGGTAGNAGGSTSFGSFITITGGAGGSAVISGTAAAAAAGVASGADYSFAGTSSAAIAAGCSAMTAGGSAGGYLVKNGTTTYGNGGTLGIAYSAGGVPTSPTASSGLVIVTEYY